LGTREKPGLTPLIEEKTTIGDPQMKTRNSQANEINLGITPVFRRTGQGIQDRVQSEGLDSAARWQAEKELLMSRVNALETGNAALQRRNDEVQDRPALEVTELQANETRLIHANKLLEEQRDALIRANIEQNQDLLARESALSISKANEERLNQELARQRSQHDALIQKNANENRTSGIIEPTGTDKSDREISLTKELTWPKAELEALQQKNVNEIKNMRLAQSKLKDISHHETSLIKELESRRAELEALQRKNVNEITNRLLAESKLKDISHHETSLIKELESHKAELKDLQLKNAGEVNILESKLGDRIQFETSLIQEVERQRAELKDLHLKNGDEIQNRRILESKIDDVTDHETGLIRQVERQRGELEEPQKKNAEEIKTRHFLESKIDGVTDHETDLIQQIERQKSELEELQKKNAEEVRNRGILESKLEDIGDPAISFKEETGRYETYHEAVVEEKRLEVEKRVESEATLAASQQNEVNLSNQVLSLKREHHETWLVKERMVAETTELRKQIELERRASRLRQQEQQRERRETLLGGNFPVTETREIEMLRHAEEIEHLKGTIEKLQLLSTRAIQTTDTKDTRNEGVEFRHREPTWAREGTPVAMREKNADEEHRSSLVASAREKHDSTEQRDEKNSPRSLHSDHTSLVLMKEYISARPLQLEEKPAEQIENLPDELSRELRIILWQKPGKRTSLLNETVREDQGAAAMKILSFKEQLSAEILRRARRRKSVGGREGQPVR